MGKAGFRGACAEPPSAQRDASRWAGQADERVSVRRGGSVAPTYPPRPRSGHPSGGGDRFAELRPVYPPALGRL